jgi:hypothetical protein
VYRRKRNGEPWVYDYVYKPVYDPTVLSRRTTYVARAVSAISNPCREGYGKLLQKVYYFTPYFVYAGSYDFSCNTFLKLRFKGHYIIDYDGRRVGMNLAPRTKLNLLFDEPGEYVVKCYQDGKLYCERRVIVIAAEQGLEETYSAWFAEHLAEILEMQMPYFGRKKVYRRGIEPPAWLQNLTGKTEQGILYRSSYRQRFMYVRQAYEHTHTLQGDHFYVSQKNINGCWNAATPVFKQVWARYHIRWFEANYRKRWKVVRQHNLWSKMVFLAAARLAFDLEELSAENWLPGVETLGDLLQVCGYRDYGLTPAQLGIRIFLNKRH